MNQSEKNPMHEIDKEFALTKVAKDLSVTHYGSDMHNYAQQREGFVVGFDYGHSHATASLIQTIENRVKELEAERAKVLPEYHPGYGIDINSRIDELRNLLTLIKS